MLECVITEFVCHGSGRFGAAGSSFPNWFRAYPLIPINGTSVGLPEAEASTHMGKTC